jgi:hypothetical protein
MTDLIKRLEDAEAGSRELGLRVFERFDLVDGERWTEADLDYALTDPDRTINPPPLTTSLDAALALAERVLPGWGWEISHDDCIGNYYAWVGKDFYLHGPQEHLRGIQETPALALCIAVLKATDTGREG